MSGHANGAAPRSSSPQAAAIPDAMTDALRAIRAAGTAGTAEGMAAAGLPDRPGLRRLLQVTMVKRASDIPVFVAAFELLFPPNATEPADAAGAGAAAGAGRDDVAGDPAADAGPASTDLLSRLVDMLRGPGAGELGGLASEVIDAYAGLGSGQLSGTERYYLYRVMRQLDL